MNFIRKYKWIMIIIIIVLISFPALDYFIKMSNKDKITNYLESQNYKKTNDVWTKQITNNSKNKVTSIIYNYTPNINKLTKEINNNYLDAQEQYRFKYNGDDTFSITYSFNNNNNCNLVQEATYNYKTKNYTCNIKYNPTDCSTRCTYIKEEVKKFDKELNNIIKNSKINEQFIIKNKD